MITKYGYSTFIKILILCLVIILISFLFAEGVLKLVLIILPFVFFLFTLNFFRDPERKTPSRNNIVVSPADGKVLFVKEVLANRYLDEKSYQISIFMSPLNVHVNRIPIDGVVEYVEYFKGKFVAAFEEKASDVNERSEFGIMSKFGKVFYTQVAGFVARRIVYDIKVGDNVNIGKRFGMIKFGSRTDVIVSQKWKPMVNKNDVVKAGESILFEYVETA